MNPEGDKLLTEQDREARRIQREKRVKYFGSGITNENAIRAIGQVFFPDDDIATVLDPCGIDEIDAAAWALAHRTQMESSPFMYKETGMDPFDAISWAKVGTNLLFEHRRSEGEVLPGESTETDAAELIDAVFSAITSDATEH